mmetsp:Transcript_120677/g.352436  ORF Transcript_120677/g.352436 Transcript_120677/m.352436 type:complete len:211 (+) Transcript_120677:343-975(+)
MRRTSSTQLPTLRKSRGRPGDPPQPPPAPPPPPPAPPLARSRQSCSRSRPHACPSCCGCCPYVATDVFASQCWSASASRAWQMPPGPRPPLGYWAGRPAGPEADLHPRLQPCRGCPATSWRPSWLEPPRCRGLASASVPPAGTARLRPLARCRRMGTARSAAASPCTRPCSQRAPGRVHARKSGPPDPSPLAWPPNNHHVEPHAAKCSRA